MSSPRLAEFSAVKICCDLLSPRLAEFSAVKICCDLLSSPRLAEFSAVKIYCELLSSPRLAEFSAVKICCDLLSSPRLAGFSAVKKKRGDCFLNLCTYYPVPKINHTGWCDVYLNNIPCTDVWLVGLSSTLGAVSPPLQGNPTARPGLPIGFIFPPATHL